MPSTLAMFHQGSTKISYMISGRKFIQVSRRIHNMFSCSAEDSHIFLQMFIERKHNAMKHFSVQNYIMNVGFRLTLINTYFFFANVLNFEVEWVDW
jgi:ubiquitin C-terminal hydrolase